MGIHGKNMLVWASKNGNLMELTNKIWGFIANHTENLMWYTINDIWVWVWYLNMGIVLRIYCHLHGNKYDHQILGYLGIAHRFARLNLSQKWMNQYPPYLVIFTGNMIINAFWVTNFQAKPVWVFTPPLPAWFPHAFLCMRKTGGYTWVHWVHWTLSHSPSMNLRMLHAAVHPLCQLFQRPLEARIPHLEMGCWKHLKAQQFLLFAVMNHHTSRKLYHRTIGFCNV